MKIMKKSGFRLKKRTFRKPSDAGISSPVAVAVPYPPSLFRGTTAQVCGLYPFATGSSLPTVGVPVGRHLFSQTTVCCDPISWFKQAGIISNPSAFVLGLPALGKSTLIKRMIIGLAAFGVKPMVLGDLKPDYVKTIRALKGQVLTIGPSRSFINPLDNSEAMQVAGALTGQARNEVLADSLARQATLLSALVTIIRKASPSDREESILTKAIEIANHQLSRPPLISDVLEIVKAAPQDLRVLALDRGSIDRYRDLTEDLEVSLTSIISSAAFGGVFSAHTSEPIKQDVAVCFDVSSVPETNTALRAAVLLTCWSYGFASISAANALAAATSSPFQHRLAIMDEMWQILRAAPAMVDRIDALTRINRSVGLGQIMCTHTMKDLEALASETERAKARGFVERAGMVIMGGLPAAEMPLLNQAIRLSNAEQEMLQSWSDPAPWDNTTGKEAAKPGLGKFLIKVGTKPGIPFKVELTESELDVVDTNEKWR